MGTAVEQLLLTGDMEIVGRITDASNGALFVTVTAGGEQVAAVYKPVIGERPLWDFPRHTLSRREVAAYRLSAWTGLDVVPETVWRGGAAGSGSVQRWVGPLPEDSGFLEREPGEGVVDLVPAAQVPDGWMKVFDGEDATGLDVSLCHADDPRLQRLALFDVLANNADRKGGHILTETDGRLLGIDHGLTFHDEPKLRTVLWGWAGEPVPADLLEPVRRLAEDFDELIDLLDDLLLDDELLALQRRAAHLLTVKRFPLPAPTGWPPIPWPPF